MSAGDVDPSQIPDDVKERLAELDLELSEGESMASRTFLHIADMRMNNFSQYISTKQLNLTLPKST